MPLRPSSERDREDLVYLRAAGLEVQRGPGHVQAPHPCPRRAGDRDDRRPSSLPGSDPLPQRELVVLAQALDVPHLEPRRCMRDDDAADLVQLAVRKDVAIDEAAAD